MNKSVFNLGFDPAILNAMPVPFVIGENGPELRVVFVNQRFTDTYGYQIEDVPTVADWAMAACPDEVYPRDLLERWGTPMEAVIMTKDGAERYVSIQTTIIGNFTITSLVDVTSIRQVEAELQTAERSLQQVAMDITENIPVGTYTMIQP
ncbi:MAG: hypothetical protein KGY57_05290, partial [Gammaproteobacteria bacterium]|nr:hypothetical protein [Gammaproteobacteria bacterium]